MIIRPNLPEHLQGYQTMSIQRSLIFTLLHPICHLPFSLPPSARPQKLQLKTCCWQLEPSQSSTMALRCLCRWSPPFPPLPPWSSLKGQPKAATAGEINTNETIICGRQLCQLTESGENVSLSLSCFHSRRTSTSGLSVVHACVWQ